MITPDGASDPYDAAACARWLIGATRYVDGCARDGVRSVEVGTAHVAIDPERDTPFPSNNPNRAMVLADGGPIEPAVARGIVEAFRSAGVKRFFVWLLPGERVGDTSALRANGMIPFRGPDYLTLVRPATESVAVRTDLTVRLLTPDDVRRGAEALGAAVEQPRLAMFLRRAADLPGFSHWAAFDGDRAVAGASSLIWENGAYLGWAATAPEFRGRGAQSALIAARIDHARANGCGWCVSETVSIGKTSLGNLMRAGFAVSFDAVVFEGASGDGPGAVPARDT